MIISMIIVLLVLIVLIILLIVTFKKDKSNNNKLKDNINNDQQNNNNNNEDEINENYINKKYGTQLLYPLIGETCNDDKECYTFYVNKDDVTDIKLPYEFLSPIKTLNNNHEEIFFKLDVDKNYDQYIITPDTQSSRVYNLDIGLPRDADIWTNNIEYNYFGGQDIRYIITSFIDDLWFSRNNIMLMQSGESLLNLIKKYNLQPRTLIDFYISLVKKQQPTIDELIDILIKFEKSKIEIERIGDINHYQTINKMLENSKYRDDRNFDNMDKELLLLIKNNDNNDN